MSASLAIRSSFLVAAALAVMGVPLRGQDKPAAQPAASTEDAVHPAPPHKDAQHEWKPLFDGKSLEGWKPTEFGGQGEVEVVDGRIVLGFGSSLTGITYQREFPKCDYEIRLEARRMAGIDFFSTLTFPVQDAFCSLVVGGWGGGVVGISSLNGYDASENGTTKYLKFNKEQWYRIRVEVRPQRIRAWIDDKPMVDVDITGHKLTTRLEVRRSQPLGITTYETRGEVRGIEYRTLPREDQSPEAAAKH